MPISAGSLSTAATSLQSRSSAMAGRRRWPVGAAPTLSLLLALLAAAAGIGRATAQQPAATSLDIAQAFDQAVAEAIARAELSVVAIARVPRDDLTQRLPQSIPPTSPDFVASDYAAGVIVDRRGLILTNYHVLGNPQENDYYVWINRRPYRAQAVAAAEEPAKPIRAEKVKAADPWMDLAILQVDADNLQPVTFGDVKDLRKGQSVIALGNPLAIARDGQASASRGIIANLQRQAPRLADARPQQGKETLHHYGTLIQTDAKLNTGMSGGALINLKGEMIGLITSLAASAGYELPAGYAVPTDEYFQQVVETLKAGREAEYGFLGVRPEHLSDAQRRQGQFGARVEILVPGTPADTAGMQLDDIVTHVDRQPIYDANDLIRELSSRLADSQVQLTVLRGGLSSGRTLRIPITLSKRYIDTMRPVIAEQRVPAWRGLRIEYATALPQIAELGHQLDPRGCVGVLAVQADSPAWQAGIRSGDLITQVEGQPVNTPQAFREAVQELTGPVRLQLSDGPGPRRERVIPQDDDAPAEP